MEDSSIYLAQCLDVLQLVRFRRHIYIFHEWTWRLGICWCWRIPILRAGAGEEPRDTWVKHSTLWLIYEYIHRAGVLEKLKPNLKEVLMYSNPAAIPRQCPKWTTCTSVTAACAPCFMCLEDSVPPFSAHWSQHITKSANWCTYIEFIYRRVI